MNRTRFTIKNIFFAYISNIITLIIGFVLRTIFIKMLSTAYLGVNGLFTNILGVLSFAELGIGTAINFSLYKPIAEKNIEKIKTIMGFYKKAYRVIALIVAVIGIVLIPFLKYIVKDPGDIGNISVYYIIILFNVVSSYFVSYKFSLVNAEQKNYIVSLVNIITVIATNVFQIIALIVYKNFLIYLIIAAVTGLAQKIFTNAYLNKKYPYLLDKNAEKMTSEELQPIKKNVIALIWLKIGDIGIYQTENIIISAFINITTVGIISNYNLLITSISAFINIIFSSTTASFGNLIATENKTKQYEIFKVYRFLAFWLYGFSAVAFVILLSPFITLWIGSEMTISEVTISLIIFNYYMQGHRICIYNLRAAGGVFVQDKYVPIIQAAVNLTVSIILVNIIGLPGVYIGGIVQGLIATIVKPIIVYRNMFKINAKYYFIDAVKFLLSVGAAYIICQVIKIYMLNNITIVNFIIMVFVTAIIPNLVFLIFFRKREEFLYLKNMLLQKIRKTPTP